MSCRIRNQTFKQFSNFSLICILSLSSANFVNYHSGSLRRHTCNNNRNNLIRDFFGGFTGMQKNRVNLNFDF